MQTLSNVKCPPALAYACGSKRKPNTSCAVSSVLLTPQSCRMTSVIPPPGPLLHSRWLKLQPSTVIKTNSVPAAPRTINTSLPLFHFATFLSPQTICFDSSTRVRWRRWREVLAAVFLTKMRISHLLSESNQPTFIFLSRVSRFPPRHTALNPLKCEINETLSDLCIKADCAGGS